MLSEASDFEIINTKHEDEDKYVKDSRAERWKKEQKETGSLMVSSGI